MYLEEAKSEAMERFGADISQNIEDFKLKTIEPWRIEQSCQKETGAESFLCDEQKIDGVIVNPGKALRFLCFIYSWLSRLNAARGYRAAVCHKKSTVEGHSV